MPRETIYRATFTRKSGGESYSAYKDHGFAIEGITRRMRSGNYVSAVLTRHERDVGTWSDERLLETRKFNSEGKEIRT